VEENIPQRSAFERLLPTDDGFSAPTVAAVTTSASLIDLNSEWGTSSEQPSENFVTKNRLARGGAWVSVQPKGGDVTVRRVRASASVAGVTGGNTGTGLKIEDGKIEDFWVDATRPKLDIIGTASLSALVYFSSRNINGGKQS
jgi:hypothetical protein